ncbi:MAG: type II toxin-antitoxin system RelE/ParE family toxin [Chloroflexi bacterium]|nr:type II toxin-antitoxin system RelE/ParE family toxin [Chloroflexota bacterium]
MPYEIVVAPEAVGDMRGLTARNWASVRDALETYLRHAPTALGRSRIKLIRGTERPLYRLRVGDLRVFYRVREERVIVLAVVPKSRANAWLLRIGGQDERGSGD